MRHRIRAAALLLTAALLCGCQSKSAEPIPVSETAQLTTQYVFAEADNAPNPRTPAVVDLENAVKITLDRTSVQVSGSGASAENGVITVSEEGTPMCSAAH